MYEHTQTPLCLSIYLQTSVIKLTFFSQNNSMSSCLWFPKAIRHSSWSEFYFTPVVLVRLKYRFLQWKATGIIPNYNNFSCWLRLKLRWRLYNTFCLLTPLIRNIVVMINRYITNLDFTLQASTRNFYNLSNKICILCMSKTWLLYKINVHVNVNLNVTNLDNPLHCQWKRIINLLLGNKYQRCRSRGGKGGNRPPPTFRVGGAAPLYFCIAPPILWIRTLCISESLKCRMLLRAPKISNLSLDPH